MIKRNLVNRGGLIFKTTHGVPPIVGPKVPWKIAKPNNGGRGIHLDLPVVDGHGGVEDVMGEEEPLTKMRKESEEGEWH
jgi:hypothetical protein